VSSRAANALAWTAFAVHLAVIVFSTVAMVTVLAAPPGPWLEQEPQASVMRLAFRFSGPAYVSLGALSALLFLAGALSWKKALPVAGAAAALALGAELIGTSTGLPFGEYHYTSLLGPRLAGLVPLAIPLSWFYMLVGCLAIAARLFPGSRGSPWRWALTAGALMVFWDLALDPAMVRTGHWVWGPGNAFHEAGLPGWLDIFFTRGLYYGMPLSNFLGWFISGTLIARTMLAVVAPASFAASVASSPLPPLLYLANGLMPISICLRDGLSLAAGLGVVGMLLPTAIAMSNAPRDREPARVQRRVA
jgi:putative membrane protein